MENGENTSDPKLILMAFQLFYTNLYDNKTSHNNETLFERFLNKVNIDMLTN